MDARLGLDAASGGTWIDIDGFPDAGLYLLFPDGHRLDLTEASVEQATERFLHNPALLPPETRAAADFQLCHICPKRGSAAICHAIMVSLPFIEDVDRYVSYDEVTAVYRARGSGLLHIRRTTMQEAVKYLAILSVIRYCEVGGRYAEYFRGVNPLMDAEEIAAEVFRNMVFACRGDMPALRALIARMQEEIQVTTHCQMQRLGLICRNDVFLNAMVAVHSTATWLDFDMEALEHPAAEPANPGGGGDSGGTCAAAPP